MSGLELPTVARIVAELDGSYMGVALYGIIKDMDWGRHGHRVSQANVDCLMFDSPMYHNLRGSYSISYYDNYPKKCIPSRSKLEVEMYSDDSTSQLLITEFDRSRNGVEVSLYHRDGRESFCIFGPKLLFGSYAEELKRYRESPVGPLPSTMNEESDMILLAHLALASAVSWRTDKLDTIPFIDYLMEPLEKMIRATHEYDQKVSIPPHAA